MGDAFAQATSARLAYGHDELLQRFRALAQEQHLHPVHILAGREGVGKLALARRLGQMLLCEEQTACGHCLSCKLGLAGRHPDILEVKPEKALLRVEDIAAVLDFSAVHGMAKARVVILPNVELLTKPAANRLLKTLEEPQSHIYFLMTSSRLRAVIPTIRSRAAICHVRPMAVSSMSMDAVQQEWYELHGSSGGLLEKAQPLLQTWEKAVADCEAVDAYRHGLQALAGFLAESDDLPSLSYIGELAWNRYLHLQLSAHGLQHQTSPELPNAIPWRRCMAEYRQVLDQIKQRELEQNIKLADQLQLQALLWRLLEVDQLTSVR